MGPIDSAVSHRRWQIDEFPRLWVCSRRIFQSVVQHVGSLIHFLRSSEVFRFHSRQSYLDNLYGNSPPFVFSCKIGEIGSGVLFFNPMNISSSSGAILVERYLQTCMWVKELYFPYLRPLKSYGKMKSCVSRQTQLSRKVIPSLIFNFLTLWIISWVLVQA